MAATYSSTKWPGRAPEGKVLMRGFVGGPQNQTIMEKSDDELVEIVLREMREILGIKGEPLFATHLPVDLGMPQYTMGHLGRVELIESALRRDSRVWRWRAARTQAWVFRTASRAVSVRSRRCSASGISSLPRTRSRRSATTSA